MIRPSKIEREWKIHTLWRAMASAHRNGGVNAAMAVERAEINAWRVEYGEDDQEFRDQLASLTATLLSGRGVHDIQKADIDAAFGIAQQIIARADAVT